jgi:hypothetical protein
MAIKAKLTFSEIKASVEFDNPTFSRVFVDPDSPNRYLSESVSFTEQVAMSLGVSTSDSATVSTKVSFDLTKPLTDGAIIGDTETIGYTSVKTDTGFASATLNQITFDKKSTDFGYVDDVFRVSSFTKLMSDTGVVGDSGQVKSQSYCDLSYFSENYVGFVEAF